MVRIERHGHQELVNFLLVPITARKTLFRLLGTNYFISAGAKRYCLHPYILLDPIGPRVLLEGHP